MKKLLLLAAAIAVVLFFNRQPEEGAPRVEKPVAERTEARSSDALADAFAEQKSAVQVTGEGSVTRVLGDDSLGDRHQRFILALDSGQSLLIAHNIDLAPRIESLREGDRVSFNGEYEWNDRGGIVHWTHHDPQGQHEAGWLRHDGRTYQ